MANKTIKMNFKPFEKFAHEASARVDRFDDWRPIGDDLHQMMIDAHKKMYSTRRGRVGEMKTLGPSVINRAHPDHLWHMGANQFEFGTRIWYSHAYTKTIKKYQRRRSHIQFPAKTKRAVLDRIALWYLEGK